MCIDNNKPSHTTGNGHSDNYVDQKPLIKYMSLRFLTIRAHSYTRSNT